MAIKGDKTSLRQLLQLCSYCLTREYSSSTNINLKPWCILCKIDQEVQHGCHLFYSQENFHGYHNSCYTGHLWYISFSVSEEQEKIEAIRTLNKLFFLVYKVLHLSYARSSTYLHMHFFFFFFAQQKQFMFVWEHAKTSHTAMLLVDMPDMRKEDNVFNHFMKVVAVINDQCSTLKNAMPYHCISYLIPIPTWD